MMAAQSPRTPEKPGIRTIGFKTLVVCILLPPILYLGSVGLLESWLTRHYQRTVNNVYLSDMNNILNGLVSVKDSIRRSIDDALGGDIFLKIGGELDIQITTRGGAILYPATYQNQDIEKPAIDPVQQASRNFALLSEGIDARVTAAIKHVSGLGVGLFLFYELSFLGGLYYHYRRITSASQRQDMQKTREISRLQELEARRQEEIDRLSREREALLSDFNQMQETFEKEKYQLTKTEEDLFAEIETLEQKLTEIDLLKEQIQELESIQQTAVKAREKVVDRLAKRFKALYKQIDITGRALEGLADLTEDMALKAEEVIHQLDADASLVTIKRKVFTKKGNATAFEVAFAYNGRLYFRRSRENRVEILTIGTKNTQQRDLGYIDGL